MRRITQRTYGRKVKTTGVEIAMERARLSDDSTGLQLIAGRGVAEGVPEISALFVVEIETDAGDPVMKALMPENCEPSSVQRETTFFHFGPGTSQIQFIRRLCVRS